MPTPDLSLLVYCRDDTPGTRWVGQDALLSEFQCDQNVYTLAAASQWLLDNYQTTVSLASVSQPTASTILFTFTDSSTQGPFDLPTATFRDRVDWAIDTPYLVNDTFNAPDGGLYRVTFDHTSDPTSFDPNANDGMGHDYYAAMIPPRGNTIPAGGAVGMYFRKNDAADYVANWAFIRASEVVYNASSDSTLTATNVADAFEELEVRLASSIIGLDALDISYTPASWLVSTTVADALDSLADINALHVVYTPSTDSTLISTNISDALEELALTTLRAANNLSDLVNAGTARTNLGLGTAATHPATDFQTADAQLFSNIPQNSKSAAYTTVLTDGQKHILHPTADNNARTFTIDSNANVAYPIGTAITFINQINTVTIAITSDTLVLAGTGTTGSRTLAAHGVATAIKIETTKWIISGTGLT